MSYPPTLFDGSPPSVKGSDTSREAAESVKESSGKTREKVFKLINTVWMPDGLGLTDDEIEDLTGMRHQSVSARRRELVLLRRVVDSGRRRKTRSGRSATVWVVTDA